MLGSLFMKEPICLGPWQVPSGEHFDLARQERLEPLLAGLITIYKLFGQLSVQPSVIES